MRARLIAAVVVAGVCRVTSADDQRPEFGGAVDVVAVDASVVDPTGRPVSDVALDEFVVKVDGRPRRVLSADFFDLRVRRAPGTAAVEVAKPGSVADPRAFPSPTSARHVVVVVDRGELSAGRMRAATEAAKGFVERLAPNDRVAVFPLPSGKRLDFTIDRAAVADALGHIGPAADVPMPENLPVRQRFEAYIRSTEDRLHALEGLLVALRSLDGPKIVVLISGGLTALAPPPERPFAEGDCHHVPGAVPCSVFGHPDHGVLQQLRGLATASAAARATFYAIYVSDRGSTHEASKWAWRGVEAEDPTVERAAMLESLIGMSGGALFEVVASADPAFERLGNEISGQYVLGLEPVEGDRDGKPHAIEVRVRREHVEVRARRQFVITPTAPRPVPTGPTVPPTTLADLVRPQDRAASLRAHAQVKEGERLLAEDAFDPAARAFESAVALDPGIVMAYYGLGKARMGLKEYAAAADAFEAARKAFRDHAEKQRQRRHEARRAGAAQASAMEAAAKSAPEIAGERAPLSYSSGMAVLEAADRTRPEDALPPGLTLALGSAYFRSGRLAEAEREYRATLEAQPKLGEARVNLAVVLLMTGRPAEAKEQLAMAQNNGYKVPAGLEKDVVAALAR